jgi:DNA polymerase
MSELTTLREQLDLCFECKLGMLATHHVFGEGPEDAEVMIVGEAPGKEEDSSGLPFQGPTGHLLDKALAHIGVARERIYVCLIVKCRPTDGVKSRTPERDEISTCAHWVEKQIGLVKPKIIIALGGVAAQTLLHVNMSVGKIRGKMMAGPHKTITVVAYHPAFLLRQGTSKKGKEDCTQFAEDLKLGFIQAGWIDSPRRKKAKKKGATI